jgi:hypothetical protein
MTPQFFTRLTLGIAALLLLVIFPAVLITNKNLLPRGLTPAAEPVDFVQYYAGAQAVKHGLWQDLYPTPKSEIYDQPSSFQPWRHTFLFNPQSAARERAFYPAVNLPFASDCSPALLAVAPEARDHFRFIYPPPAALLFWPLSLFSFTVASGVVWPTLAYVSLFVAISISVALLRRLQTHASHAEGLVVIASLLIVFFGPLSLADGNITPILSGLIALAVLAFLNEWALVFAAAFILLFLSKTIGALWLPLLLIERRAWKIVGYLAAIAILLNLITLALGGVEVYRTFFSLLPLIGIPAGQGLVPTLLQLFGFYPRALYGGLQLALLGALYFGYWKHGKRGPERERRMVALLGGTMALYCLLNFSVWWHYVPGYIVLPFLGWMAYEFHRASGGWKLFLSAALVYVVIAMTVGWRGNSTLGTVLHRPAMVLVPLIFLAAAIRGLYQHPNVSREELQRAEEGT